MKNYNGTCELISENLSNLGGRMGTEYTTVNFRKFKKSVDEAKKEAEEDFGKPIKWKKVKNGWSSGDLSYVMYTINEIKFT